jgi:hypothetical protein
MTQLTNSIAFSRRRFTAFSYLAFYWYELQLKGIQQKVANVKKTKRKMYITIGVFSILRSLQAASEVSDNLLLIAIGKGTKAFFLLMFAVFMRHWGMLLLDRLHSITARTTTGTGQGKETKASKKKKKALQRFKRFLLFEGYASALWLAEQGAQVGLKQSKYISLGENPFMVFMLKIVQRGTEFIMMALLAYLVCLKTASFKSTLPIFFSRCCGGKSGEKFSDLESSTSTSTTGLGLGYWKSSRTSTITAGGRLTSGREQKGSIQSGRLQSGSVMSGGRVQSGKNKISGGGKFVSTFKKRTPNALHNNLPEGWKEERDENGGVFYINPTTNKIQKIKPTSRKEEQVGSIEMKSFNKGIEKTPANSRSSNEMGLREDSSSGSIANFYRSTSKNSDNEEAASWQTANPMRASREK